jgi:hypothetical protein
MFPLNGIQQVRGSTPQLSSTSMPKVFKSISTPRFPVPFDQPGFRSRDVLTLVWPDSVSSPLFIPFQIQACPAKALAYQLMAEKRTITRVRSSENSTISGVRWQEYQPLGWAITWIGKPKK